MSEPKTYKFAPPNELLPVDVLKSLSHEAVRIYTRIWNTMNFQNTSEVAIVNSVLCHRASVLIDRLTAAQSELARAGLLDVELDARPGFALEAQRTTYRYAEEQLQEA